MALRTHVRTGLAAICVLWAVLVASGTAGEQEEAPAIPLPEVPDQPPVLADPLGIGGLPGMLSGDERVRATAEFRVVRGSRDGQISLSVDIDSGWHIYSITQPAGGPLPSKIELLAPSAAELRGTFQPNAPPQVKNYEVFRVPVEEHSGRVVWTAPLNLRGDAAPESLSLKLRFSGLVCTEEGSCVPVDPREITARFAGYIETTAASDSYRGDRTHASLRGEVKPRAVRAGGRLELSLTAVPDGGWHIYAYASRDPGRVSKPTLIVVTAPSSWRQTTPQSSSAPKETRPEFLNETVSYHEGLVTWTMELHVPEDMAPGEYEIAGQIAYQTCTDTRCDMPAAAEFRARVTVAKDGLDGPVPLVFAKSSYGDVARLAAPVSADSGTDPRTVAKSAPGGALDLSRLEVSGSSGADMPTAIALLVAFVGGFILNFMPCVLPVIGLKIMAFVQQSGDSRGRVFLLNLWYCLGLISVFLVLASLAVFTGLGWGAQFSNVTFNVVLNSVVFVFALSFLGVWEITLPGFVGSGTMQSLSQKEGMAGAFAKGVLTTVLATPCSGPFIAPALTWAVSQPAAIAYAAFACAGLGMASPYLLIGAFPRLVSFLPKPGEWMETFKHAMGFVLLGTVVFLMTFLDVAYVVPTFAFLIGLWAAFWWIGRIPIADTPARKLRSWIGGAAFAALIGLISFGWLHDVMNSRLERIVDQKLSERRAASAPGPGGNDSSLSTGMSPGPTNPLSALPKLSAPARGSGGGESAEELPWQPYSLSLLEQLTAQRKTVFVDFTADW